MYKCILSILFMAALGCAAQTNFTRHYYNGSQSISSNSVLQNSDGSYIMAGKMDTLISATQGYAGFIKKSDAAGNLLSTQYYSIPNTSGLEFRKIIKTMDGNYIVVGMIDHSCIAGSTLQDILVSKIDTLGTMLWYKSYGEQVSDIGVDVKELSDGNLVIQSWFAKLDTNFTPYTSFHLIKTNATGDSLWTRHYYHNDRVEQFATTLVETSDGGFALAGSMNDQNGGLKGYLIKTDSLGIEQWNKTIDSTSENYSELVNVYSNNGNITVIAKVYGVSLENTIISNFNNSGSLNWTNTLVENDVQVFTSTRSYDGGYALIGESIDALNPHPVLIKLDSTGNKVWRRDLDQLLQQYPTAIIQAMDNDFIVTGNSVSYDPYSVFLAKTADSAVLLNSIKAFVSNTYSVYPNPATQFLRIDRSKNEISNIKAVKIINLHGQVVKSVSPQEIQSGRIDISDLSPGVYFIAFYTVDGSNSISKIIKE
ncbi:MAG: T9SS type A sorting domain-containing protein [Bacteroidales bacterium]|nr:T9SS type A sorting domain-containing protein [Bacteroidales bacterium]